MWYGGYYSDCHRHQQSLFCKEEIRKLDKPISFLGLLDLGYNQVQAARIIYILNNPNFPNEDSEYYD